MKSRYYFSFMFLYILFVAVACVSSDKNRAADQAEIEAFIGASLPSSVADKQSEWQRGVDDSLMLKFSMSETDLEPFLSNLGFDEPLRKSYRPFFDSGSNNNWWDTTQLTEFMGGAVNQAGKTYEVIVDTSLENKVIVYLMVYER